MDLLALLLLCSGLEAITFIGRRWRRHKLRSIVKDSPRVNRPLTPTESGLLSAERARIQVEEALSPQEQAREGGVVSHQRASDEL